MKLADASKTELSTNRYFAETNGMFGKSLVDKATDGAIAGLRGLIDPLRGDWGPGVPESFWNDPYIVGFTFSWIGHFAKQSTAGKITGADLGTAGTLAYESVSKLSGSTIMRRAMSLLSQRDKDFLRGGLEANLIFLYSQGVLENEDSYPLVSDAKAAARASGTAPDRGKVLSLMMTSLHEQVMRIANGS